MKKIIAVLVAVSFSFMLAPAYAEEPMPWDNPDQKPLLKMNDGKSDKEKEKKKKATAKKKKKKKAQQDQK